MYGATLFDGSSRTRGGVDHSGGMLCRHAAARYGVAASTAIKWVERLHRAVTVAAGQMGGHKPKKGCTGIG